MTGSLLEDVFAHNVWATLRLLDACIALSPEQLDTAVPGTYGSILDTARHLVGSETHAATGIRLAQVLHHGTDHRSQICTALTTLGMKPPDIDVWAYGEQNGRLVEVPPTS
jgi:uncharacterized damage-inducible protein DinB